MEHKLNIGNVLLWTVIYFFMCGVITTAIDITIWRNFDKNISSWLNITTLIVFNVLFIIWLTRKSSFNINILKNISIRGITLAIGCSILFFLLLDKCLDPVFDSMFPMSGEAYQETLIVLKQEPVVNFIRICLLAPVIEEILMRGYVLKGLQNKYGIITALMVSTFLFALLHFNFVQTVSALICGLILGLLYINTDCLICCILAHFLYNSISYFTTILA
ncbi:type II CAAX endopeptidase family protein [Paraclostridium ghonii]|uniref:CPBP family intramembrane glutamic endopeptidase n=1 Tax=Paraclostridium ghonii TaxID=29358 RepID=UPI0035255853